MTRESWKAFAWLNAGMVSFALVSLARYDLLF